MVKNMGVKLDKKGYPEFTVDYSNYKCIICGKPVVGCPIGESCPANKYCDEHLPLKNRGVHHH